MRKEIEKNQSSIIVVNNNNNKTGYYLAETFSLRSDHITESQYVPLYDLYAFAGLVPANVEEHEPDELVYVQSVPLCDGAMRVKGNSMYPKLENGDMVLYKTTQSRRGGLFFGEMYVVAYIEDGEEHIVIKYVDESPKDGYYTLRSANPEYAPWDIPRDSVRQLAIVKASIRHYTM